MPLVSGMHRWLIRLPKLRWSSPNDYLQSLCDVMLSSEVNSRLITEGVRIVAYIVVKSSIKQKQ